MIGAVAIVGSLNADLVVTVPRFPNPGETLVGGDLVTMPGGKSANQAVAAARLGSRVRMVGAVGDDANGELLRRGLRAAGVDDRLVRVRTGTATGSALITVDGAGENTIVLSPGANASLLATDVDPGLFDGCSVLGLCLEVPGETVVAAARAARAEGVTVVTNLSPVRTGLEELLELTDVLLVNESEAAAVPHHGVRRWIETRGPRGCVVHDGDRPAVEIAASPVAAIDTTGCGDAFMGAVLSRLAAAEPLETAARFGSLVAAYAATGRGAQASYPDVAELEVFTAGRTP